MRVINLVAENVKKIRAIDITPHGDIVTISGKNASGKSSTLDCLWYAIAGTSNIPSQPIRKGETKARIKLDLGDIIVERKFNEHGSSLTVESADGARYPSPQKLLDSLLGELSFDPLAFARMEPRKQFDELRRVAKLEVDIDKLDALNASDFAKRTEVNRDAKAKRAQADGVVVPPEVNAETVDETALVDELQKAGETNTDIETRKGRRDTTQLSLDQNKRLALTHADSVKGIRIAADEAYKKAGEEAKTVYDRACKAATDALAKEYSTAEEFERAAAQAVAQAKHLETKLAEAPPLPAPIDVSALRQRIDQARRVNTAIAQRKTAVDRKAQFAAEASELETQSREITERMDARKTTKLNAIASAAMPVPGLSFGDGVVTFNSIPFDQASSAEQLRVSMAIAMAGNPKLRVIRITDGSLLDEDSLSVIGEMAKADDFQVWIEQVSSSGKVGVVIDDGAVASTPESRAREEATA